MPYPSSSDYIQFLFQLLDEFAKGSAQNRSSGRPVTHTNESLIVFFSIMVLKGCTAFLAQWRWLVVHPQVAQTLRFSKIPSRRTLSRRFKALENVILSFIEFVGQWATPLGEAFQSEVVYEDKSLFKAQGAVWHKKDQKANRIPKGVRNLDTEASWSKSGYHGWVFGYGLHATVTGSGFPLLAEVKTAKVSEQTVLTQKQDMLFSRNIGYLIGDDGYTNFDRTEKWAKRGVILVTPALKATSEKGEAYKRFSSQSPINHFSSARKTAIEPIFDLVSQLLATTANHKQLPVKGLANVTTFLSLGVLLTQLAMLINTIWGLPLRNISHLLAIFL